MSNTKNYNLNEYLKLLNDSYKVITNKFSFKHHNGTKISEEEIKMIYQGFYVTYGSLMKDKKLPNPIKMDIIAKKEIIDTFYPKNITYSNYNFVKVYKSLANKIPKNITYSNNNNNLSANLAKLRIKP
jgi:hypothetical protein